jgi:PAS domain S-box-containing protein
MGSIVTEELVQPAASAGVGNDTYNRWWRCLFDISEDPQLVCRADGRAVELNRRAQQLLGVQEAAADVGACLLTVLTPPVHKRLQALLQKSGPHPETLTAVTLVFSGRLGMIADLGVTPLGDGFSLVSIKDASRRWRMESHVQRLITAVDSTTDVVFLTDAEFRLTFVNAAFQGVTGHSVEDVLGRSADFLRAPGQEPQTAAYHACLDQGQGWMGELLNLRNDGSIYPVEAAISPIFDKRGALLGCAAIERDISSKKKLQEELLLERDLVRSILHSLDAAVYTLDRAFCLTHVNDGWKKLPPAHGWLQLDAAPESGRSLLEYVPEAARRAELQGLFESVLATQQPKEIEVCSGDRRYHWLVKITPWRHEREVQGLIYTVTDHSYLHQLQSQLYQAQKMETIGALAAGVAHDFNNLLLAIRGNTSLLLLSKQLPDEARRRLQQIDQAAGRAGDITAQLLSFSRASDEREIVVDFNEVLQEASQLAKRSIRGQVRIVVEVAPAPLKVLIDPARAQQVLLNLCVNAQDAMPQGGQLTLRGQLSPLTEAQAAKLQELPGTTFVHASVQDTGTGIPVEVLSRIFDPFFTTKEKGKGTGLGLSIVHSVVTKAGGLLEVDTSVGIGTTFNIYLPVAQGALANRDAAPTGDLPRGAGRILVVDDLDLVLDFTRSFLMEAGYDVLVASSGEQALEILAALDKPVDLLLTDYNMTGKTGVQLIREVAVRWPDIKFILASGYLEDHERARIESELDARILHKPFNVRDAAALVAAALNRKPESDP